MRRFKLLGNVGILGSIMSGLRIFIGFVVLGRSLVVSLNP
jgi:hypothetical protein